MNLTEKLVVTGIVGILAAIAVPPLMRAIGNAQVTSAMLQIHQTAKQSQYDVMLGGDSVNSVRIYSGNSPSYQQCSNGECGAITSLPKGVVIKSTFAGIDSGIAGNQGADRATVISWASQTAAGIGGSSNQHGTVAISHPWTDKRFCIVRGGKYGNQGLWQIRSNHDCKK